MNELADLMTVLSQGNPGCANMLVTVWNADIDDFMLVARTLINHRIFGSRAYMLWNDACAQDGGEFMRVIRAISSGELPMETVDEHLSKGWCEPFELTKELEGQR